MLSQDEFVAARSPDWRELEAALADPKELYKHGGARISRIAALYRSLSSDLMRSRAARFAPDLVSYLNALAARAHSVLYGARPLRLPAGARLLLHDFPRILRQRWPFFALSAALFFIPLALGTAGALASPDFASAVLPASTLEGMAEAYSKGFGDGRPTGQDAGMAGFYVYNNVGIAFRCFATGVLFGAGTLFFLVYNGLVIGTVLGHVARLGYAGNILTFMCGHAPFELTAIIIAGAAGLFMGHAIIDTKGRTRVGSLRAAAPEIAALVLGAAAMLVVAALVEGFWSPSSIPAPVKWAASAIFTALVTAHLALGGRGRARA
jgi:uncharacterized membrane protein SpoIIM required for sporulation